VRKGSRRRRILVAIFASVFALALPATMVLAGTLTLHPAGFGEKSKANWKAMEGRPDSGPQDSNQALYMQKGVPTPQNAAGVAVIKGLEGQTADVLTGLSWEHRTDSHCGAGAPRWLLGVRTTGGQTRNVFLGCDEAAHVQTDARWCKDSFPGPAIESHILAAAGEPASEVTIRYLLIIFDEGPDNPNPQPAGCTPPAPFAADAEFAGFVYLDNIQVTTGTTTRTWMSASDNGNGSTAFFGPSVAVAADLPSVSDVLATLQDAFPGVPVTSWVLYPDVEFPTPSLP
jgi:hypothetical protein